MTPSLLQVPESWPQLDSSLLIASRSKQGAVGGHGSSSGAAQPWH